MRREPGRIGARLRSDRPAFGRIMGGMADRVIMTRLTRGRAPGREFDIAFWQALGPTRIFEAAWDLVVTAAAAKGKLHWRSGLAAPIVVRLPSGGGVSGGPFHSQNPEAWFMHAPGLKVLAPSSAHDAKGLLLAAIADPNPVIFLEHKYLYRRVRGEVPEGAYETPLSASTVRAGEDLVVIAYGAMVHAALAAAEQIEEASVRVLDLRALVPLDERAILDAVHDCSKVVIVDEANYTCAAGAQVASLIAQYGYDALDGPVVRVATPDAPVPFAPALERAAIPGAERIRDACRELLAY